MGLETRQSKVRNRAVEINEIAISKVPRTRIPGLTNDENAFIQESHRYILRRAMELCKRCRNLEMECAVVFNIRSKQAIYVDGVAPGCVDCYINESDRKFMKCAEPKTLIYMHNHPSTGTFSANDVKVFCRDENILVMTAVGNDGSVYVLAKSGYSLCGEFMYDYRKLSDDYKAAGKINNATFAIRDMLKVADRYKITYKKGRHL